MDWLCNRQPDRWKKLKHVELSGKDGRPVKTESLVAVPSGPMSIEQWEKQVKEARENDKKAEKDALDYANNIKNIKAFSFNFNSLHRHQKKYLSPDSGFLEAPYQGLLILSGNIFSASR